MATQTLDSAKVTTKYQTTIPQAVRKKLGITQGDRIVFELEGERVYIRKVQPLDLDYLRAVSGTLDEWASAADEAAYGDL
jgi:AbrB family looped-hinge helix DNA binding protein